MARHECIEDGDLIRAGLKVPNGTWIIDLDTGVVGKAGGFHGERSFNGNPFIFRL